MGDGDMNFKCLLIVTGIAQIKLNLVKINWVMSKNAVKYVKWQRHFRKLVWLLRRRQSYALLAPSIGIVAFAACLFSM